jgi:hypothetical protein
MQLRAFDDLLGLLDIQALHSQMGSPAGGERKE